MTILTKSQRNTTRSTGAEVAGTRAYRAIAETIGTLNQQNDIAFHFQSQWITVFLAVVLLVSIIAGLYLNITARSAIYGREIQILNGKITENQQQNADLQTQIALLLSNDALQQRAEAMQYVPVDNKDIDYIVIPGYHPQAGISMAAPTSPSIDVRNTPQYTESLFGWLSQQLDAASLPLAQGK